MEATVIKGPFVVVGLSPWNINYGCNMKDMSLELARHHKVLYIDTPLKRKERWLQKDQPLVHEAIQRRRTGKSIVQINENLWHCVPEAIMESVNSLNIDFLFDQVNRINNLRFASAIKKAVAEMGFDRYVLINDNDVYNGFYLKQMLSPALYVYYLRDMLSAFSYWKRHVGRLEPTLMSKADLVVTNSEYLSDYARKYNPHSYYIGQGCDITAYTTKPGQDEVDAALRGISRPIVGYVGALNAERLDLDLIQGIAQRLPTVNIVLVGPEDKAFRESALHGLKNVFFLGKKEISELPKYIHGFDVCINPQLLNEITIGNYPRKVDEYLAAGTPVVATSTDAMRPFSGHVYLADNVDQYSALISQALAENSEARKKERIEFASQHTWTSNIHELLQAIGKVTS